MPQKFVGTGVALITPFLKTGLVDYTALEKLVKYVSDNGVDFLVVLGTTGETPTLSNQEKQDILDAVVSFNDLKLPIVCGMGGNNTLEVIQQLTTMNLDAVDAILSVAPYYNKPTQEGIFQHFKAIADETDLKVLLYNVPGRTSSNILPSTVIRLANECKNIIGIKEASGNIPQCMELIQLKPDNFLVLSGDDNLILPQIAIGMDGIISVAANCFPKDFTEMVNNLLVGRYEHARKTFYKLLPGVDLLFAEGNPAGAKSVLSQKGICTNVLRLPLVPVSHHLEAQIKYYLSALY